MAKHINEHYFDTLSKENSYVLGAFYAGYLPRPNSGFLFRSKNKDLVEIIKKQLESDSKITSDNREKKSSHWIELNGPLTNLTDILSDQGLAVPKNERTFPDTISRENLSHFVRGFFDANGYVYIIRPIRHTHFNFNTMFLRGMHQVLTTYAGVARTDAHSKDHIVYSHIDSMKIRDFIYQDWDLIKKAGLYLPKKRSALMTTYDPIQTVARKTQRRHEARIQRIKRLLEEGKSMAEVTRLLGFKPSVLSPLCAFFKQQTGTTPARYRFDCGSSPSPSGYQGLRQAEESREKVKQAEKLLATGMKLYEVAKQLGYTSSSGLSSAFKKKGIPYLDTNIRQRIEMARQSIEDGVDLDTVAHEAGYVRKKGFFVMFKKHTGIKYTDFKRRLKMEAVLDYIRTGAEGQSPVEAFGSVSHRALLEAFKHYNGMSVKEFQQSLSK